MGRMNWRNDHIRHLRRGQTESATSQALPAYMPRTAPRRLPQVTAADKAEMQRLAAQAVATKKATKKATVLRSTQDEIKAALDAQLAANGGKPVQAVGIVYTNK